MKSTILVVDDIPENTILLSRILKNSGYEVQSADCGSQAVSIAASQLPDLIILDIRMPQMDGIETCQQLKSDLLTKDIPIIFISALDDSGDKARAFKAGGVDYIVKPFEYDEVQARVETQLLMRRLRLQLEEANRDLAARVEELTLSHKLLAERETRLRAFVKALPDLSFIMDDNGRYLEVMAGETSLLIAQPKDLIGRLVTEVMPPEEGSRILEAIQLALKKGSIQVVEYKIPILAGGEHWFEARIACMEKDQGGHGKVVMIASEITERVKLYQQIQRLANEDGLTGCMNRRYFMEKAAQEIQRIRRYKRSLSILMMDLDNYKNFNDRLGHQIGDRVLCAVVELCQRELRGQDMLGRYGGDEFIVLMPETSLEGALKAAERLRNKIENMVLPDIGDLGKVTVSMGLASLESESDESCNLDALIRRADDALYVAKNDGKNIIRTS